MLLRRLVLGLTVSLLLALSISVVSAAPSLSLGSTASYTVTGNIATGQNCTATPALYNAQACLGIVTPQPQTHYISIVDSTNCSYNTSCGFNPPFIEVSQRDPVVWTNTGLFNHTVTANMTLNQGLPNFDSGIIMPSSSYQFTFSQTGFYSYYDSLHPATTRGAVLVTAPLTSNSVPIGIGGLMPDSLQVGLSGNLNWKVLGLSSSEVNLNVSHDVGVSVSSIVSFTPVSEAGSYEQSINLSTRVESPGTATSLVQSLLSSYLQALSGVAAGSGYSGVGSQSGLLGASDEPSYADWWVNGPLSDGTPIQILQGWGSVTGSESLDLGGNIGVRQAWIVNSELTQSFNLNIPQFSNPSFLSAPSSSAQAILDLRWSYDKSADLLLRSNDTLTLVMKSDETTQVYTGSTEASVAVSRTMTVKAALTLQLSSTTLNLGSPSQVPILGSFGSMPWMPLGLVGASAAVIAGVALWFGKRARLGTMTPVAAATPPPPLVPPPETSSVLEPRDPTS